MAEFTALPSIAESAQYYAQRQPDAVAVIGPSGRLTWEELHRAAGELTRRLTDAGIGPGDRVGWLGANDTGYPVALLAGWQRRASLVGLNWRLSADDVRSAVAQVGIDFVIAGPDQAELVSSWDIAHVVATAEHLQAWAEAEPELPVSSEPGDEGVVFFTSGSTGTPKAVPISREAVETHAATPTGHRFGTDSRLLIVPPTFHLAGACWAQYALVNGATQVYLADAVPPAIAQALVEHEITHAVFVPLLIQLLVEEAERTGTRFPALRHIAYGASPIAPSLLQKALTVLDCEFYQVYGMSEGGGVVTTLPVEDHVLDGPKKHRLESAGRPVPGAEVRIVDVLTDESVPVGVSGEICVRTTFMSRGYIGNDRATREVFDQGWLRTKDAGYVDEDGYLYIQGRTDDMIITGGENVHPGEVENVLATMPEVAECAVFGVPDERWGNRVVAAVVPRDGSSLTEEGVIDYCRPRLGGIRTPKVVLIVDELLRTPTGKVRRSEMAKEAEGRIRD